MPETGSNNPFSSEYQQQIVDSTIRNRAALESEIKDVEGKQEIPNHGELKLAYEHGTHDEKLSLSMGVMERVMRDAGIKEQGLGVAQQIEGDFLDLTKEEKDPGGPNKPQVYFKKITKEKGLLRKREVDTGEVLIIARVNNSSTGEDKDSTVVASIVKHTEDGKIVEGRGLYTLLSQEQYQQIINAEGEDAEKGRNALLKEFLGGEHTHDEVKKDTKKFLGKSHDRFWRQHDKKVAGTPENWKTKAFLEDRLERLETDYSELLQQLYKNYMEIMVKELEALEELRRIREEEIFNNPEIYAKLVEYKNAKLLKTKNTGLENALLRLLGVSGIDKDTADRLINRIPHGSK